MRTIERTGQFKRDFKRESKGHHRKTLESDIVEVITALANDQPLPEKGAGHPHPVRQPTLRKYRFSSCPRNSYKRLWPTYFAPLRLHRPTRHESTLTLKTGLLTAS